MKRKVFYIDNVERETLIHQAEENGEALFEDAITIEGNYLIFTSKEDANGEVDIE